jgi:acyl-CoA thioester hydrolase
MARIDVPIQLRWNDLDAYGHVNNAAMLVLLEEARIAAFWSHPETADTRRADAPPTAVLDAGPHSDLATLVARNEIEYLRPLSYRRAPVHVVLWVGHLGGASLDVCYEVQDVPPGAPAADGTTAEVYVRATTTVVLVDAATGSPRRIGDRERAAWEPYLEEPVQLRRRR